MKLYNQNIPTIYPQFLVLITYLILANGCSDFVEVEPPKNTLITETVFEDVNTAESALANIYIKMRDQGMLYGSFGLGVGLGSYSDELDYYGATVNNLSFYNHNVTASNTSILGWWSNAYNLIYAANDVIEGVEKSTALLQEDKEALKGQALFVRAFMHSLLVGLYGNVPYIETTDYLENSKVERMPVTEVYEKIISDLITASDLLDDASGERVLPNKSTANALLARMYLYTGEWALAETTASDLIDIHTLETDVNNVFLKNSEETLWQFKPDGITHNNTYEGGQLIIVVLPTFKYALTNSLLNAFESGDLRRSSWIESITDGTTTLHYAYKYKANEVNTDLSLEYSILFRLAEQYLIRAEARTHLNDIAGAQSDLNIVRNRAGLSNSSASNSNDLLDAILQERRVELFTEQGHRWFDLLRMDKAEEVLMPTKSNWQNTNVLFPIPETELLANPNLEPQNLGY